MGIIKKQTILSTLFIYSGIGIGFVNAIILMPHLFTSSQIGLLSFITSLGNVFSTFFTLGVPLVVFNMFSKFRNLDFKAKKGFLAFVTNSTLFGIFLGCIVFFFCRKLIFNVHVESQDIGFVTIVFLLFFAAKAIFRNLDVVTRMLYSTVLGVFSENFLAKVSMTAAIAFYYFSTDKNFDVFIVLYFISLSLSGLISIGYNFYKRHLAISFFSMVATWKQYKNTLMSLMFYGFIGSVGAVIVFEIDKIMISEMLNLSNTGIYTIAFYFCVFIKAPTTSLRRIATVLMADAWKNNDTETVKKIYYKSCISQYLIGAYLFLGIWLNVNEVYSFLPEEYLLGKYVLLFLGLAQLVDMLTGVSNELVSSSNYYKHNTTFVVIMMFLVAGLNYLLIPIWGINGAAISTLLSITISNSLRYLFIYKKFNFQPFNFQFVKSSLIIGGVFFFIDYLSAYININPIVNILIKGSILTLLFWFLVLKFKVSEDVNQMYDNLLKKIMSKLT